MALKKCFKYLIYNLKGVLMSENINNSDESEVQPAVEQINESVAQNSKSDEVAKLHRECAKYRTALNASKEEKQLLLSDLENLKKEFEIVLKQKNNQNVLFKLEKMGCLKPDLVMSEIPEDCSDFDEFLKNYISQNSFLFKKQKLRHGFSFQGGKTSNYTTSQQMNNYIRSALGR
jgi:hypothetical protein